MSILSPTWPNLEANFRSTWAPRGVPNGEISFLKRLSFQVPQKTANMTPMVRKTDPNMTPKTTTKWYQNDTKIDRTLFQNRSKIEFELLQHRSKIVPKLLQHRTEIAQKIKMATKLIQNRSNIEPKLLLHCSNKCTPVPRCRVHRQDANRAVNPPCQRGYKRN